MMLLILLLLKLPVFFVLDAVVCILKQIIPGFFFSEKEDIFYYEFVEDQLLSGSVSHRHIHVTVLDASLVIMTSDHPQTHRIPNESLKELDTSLSEIQEEEEKEVCELN